MRSQVPAYALFAGKVGPTSNSQIVRDVVLPITSLPTSLGRAPNVDGHLMVDEGDSTLSREHLRVNFNPLKGCYEVACLSKNGAIVDKIRIKKGEVAEVHANSAVRLGSARMYFTVPVDFVEGGSHALAAATAGAGATVAAPASAPTTTDTTIAPGANDDGWLKGDAGAIEPTKTKKRKIAVAASPAVHKAAAAVVAEKTQEPPAKMARLDSVVAASASTSTSASTAISPKSRGKASKANAPPEVIVLSSSSEDTSSSAAAATTAAAVAQVHLDTAASTAGGAGSSSRSGSTAVPTVTLNGLCAADLLARAFSSGDLPLTATGGVDQAAVHTWIVDNEKDVTEVEPNMKRAIYTQLTKKNSKYKRVESEAPSAEGPKKMPILWAPI